MAKVSGSIVLGTTRVINGVVPLRGRFSIQLLCDNLSAETTFYLEMSADKTNYDVATENGVDIEDSILDGVAKFRAFEGNPGDYWRIRFDGATTGTVAYIVNAV